MTEGADAPTEGADAPIEGADSPIDGASWPLVEAVSAPIPGDNPCGVDATYEDDYQRLKASVDGLSAARADDVDFGLMVDLGEKVVTTRSKDLRAATFLAFGLERTRGAAGLAEGLAVIEAMAKSHWEGMYPSRERMTGRQNALQSLSDRLKDWVAGSRYTPDARVHLEAAHSTVKALQQFTMAKMDERAPALSGLAQAIEEAIRKIPIPRAAPVSPPMSVGGTEGARGDAIQAVSEDLRHDGDSTFRSPVDAVRGVEGAIDFLRKSDPESPLPCMLLRSLRWGVLEDAPPNENGKTLIPPPPSARLEALSRIAEAGNHEQLFEAAEDAFFEFPLWLDLQRYVVNGLEGLGPSRRGVREAVLSELEGLLRRIGSLPELTFRDGTPFADGTTRAWLETALESNTKGDGQGGSMSVAGSAELEEAFSKARSLLSKNDLKGALAAMQHGAENDRDGRVRYQRRLRSARICMTARQFVLARPILEGLEAEIERHGLADWEPALALETFATLYQCLDELARGSTGTEQESLRRQTERALDKIVRIDASKALAIMGSGKR